LTANQEDHHILEAVEAKVSGYLLKNNAVTDLIQAIRAVCRGMVYLAPDISPVVVAACTAKNRGAAAPLGRREREVLRLIADGKTTRELAAVGGIGFKPAVSHRSRIMEKLGIHNRAALVRYAVRHGIVPP